MTKPDEHRFSEVGGREGREGEREGLGKDCSLHSVHSFTACLDLKYCDIQVVYTSPTCPIPTVLSWI